MVHKCGVVESILLQLREPLFTTRKEEGLFPGVAVLFFFINVSNGELRFGRFR